MYIDQLLRGLVELEGSDLHLRVGEPPVYRVHGKLSRTKFPIIESVEDIIYPILSDERRKRFEDFMELDLSYEIKDVARFRVNCFRQRRHMGAVLRAIPVRVKTVDELVLPPITKEICLRRRGLVLVTGPTGSGKSTTLAAMIDHINRNRRCHVITIEDPIEFVHEDKLSEINQRELEIDTHTFAAALKHVMRQNPDVILVGEMRDLETISLAITAAETGHLVFATLHTTDAPQTIDRVIDVFAPEQQNQIRMQLSVTVQAIVSQTLIARRDITGRIAAFEIMVATPAIRTLIREGKTHQIYSDIQAGREHGMISLDQYLIGLLKKRYIEYEDALSRSSNPRDFEQLAARQLQGVAR
ncbi:MAG: type IV pili twitching motility protein PilT [Armatimonadetes bacterium RBG_16_58_9]|nr:MAG: type IV pili twitching motility protein PilT [Armatimonadetes bacterium RBG_16_58_9]